MSSISTFARSRQQRGWFHQRYKGTLFRAAFDGLFSSRSRKISGFNCNTTTFNGRLPLRPVLCQSFNTHRRSIVERFGPIRFSAPARHSAFTPSQCISAAPLR